MRTVDILTRLPVVRRELAGLAAGPGVDRTNKQFELRALMTELARRKIDIELICNSISDTGGGAAPPEDEVWLALNGGGAPTIAMTATKTFNEYDRAGAGGTASDDVLTQAATTARSSASTSDGRAP